MIVEILFFILIILIVILFLCVKKVYTGGFIPKSAGLPAVDPDDNSIVFFEMGNKDINKYIDIVTYKDLITSYETLDASYENDRSKADVVPNNDRQYKTIRDWFIIDDNFKYTCHDDFKWGNSAFSFICGKSRTDNAGSVKQNLKKIINDYVAIKAEIANDTHPPACANATKCIYCLSKDTNIKYLIYLYDAYRNSNIYPNLIKTLKDEYKKLKKHIYDTLFDATKSSMLQNGGNNFVTAVSVPNGFVVVNNNNQNCLDLSYIIIIFYLCNNNLKDLNKFDKYYKFFRNSIDKTMDNDVLKGRVKTEYDSLFNIVSAYFQLNKHVPPVAPVPPVPPVPPVAPVAQVPLTPYQTFINEIIDSRDIMIGACEKIDKYYDIINKISVIIYYNLHMGMACTLLNVVDVNKDPIPAEIPSNEYGPVGVDGKKTYQDEYIHKYIMYILFLIAKNTLKIDIQNIGAGDVIFGVTLDDVIGNSPTYDDSAVSDNNYLYKNDILNVNGNITTNPTNKYYVISDEDNCIWKGPLNPQWGDSGIGKGYIQRVRGRGRGGGWFQVQVQTQNLGNRNNNCHIRGVGKYRRVLYTYQQPPPPPPPPPQPPYTCLLKHNQQIDLNIFIKFHAIKIEKILEPHIQKAIKYYEAADRLILLEGTADHPEYGFQTAIQKLYYDTNINTFRFMRQTLIIYPDSFLGVGDDDFTRTKTGVINTYAVKCNNYSDYRMNLNNEIINKNDNYGFNVKYITNPIVKVNGNDEVDHNDDNPQDIISTIKLNYTECSNVMALPFVPIKFSDINANVELEENDRKYYINDYCDLNALFLNETISNIIRFICEHNIRFVLYDGLGKGEFKLPSSIQKNIEKIFKDNLTDLKITDVLQQNLDKYVKYCNRLFSTIPRFFSAITTNAYYVQNANSVGVIDNFIITLNASGDMDLKSDAIKIIDNKGVTSDGFNVVITMNISHNPEKFTVYNYDLELYENVYDGLPIDHLITKQHGGVSFIDKLSVKKADGTLIDPNNVNNIFTYIGTNLPSVDETIERKKPEPKQIYGGPQTNAFSISTASIPQKSTQIESSQFCSPAVYKESCEKFNNKVEEFSSSYIPENNTSSDSQYGLCFNDSFTYFTIEEMEEMCDRFSISISKQLFAVESSEPIDDYEKIRISQELHKLDQNIPEIKMPRDLKLLNYDPSKKNKIRIKKVIRGLNGKVLSIDDIHTIYINIS